MTALILKSANRLYKLCKVYATMALLGALTSIVGQIVLAEPIVLVAAFMVVSAASIIVLLSAQSQKLNQPQSHELEHERPPILPE